MQSTVHTIALNGIEAVQIEVQCQIARGPMSFSIVGLPDKCVKEAKERISAAFYAHAMALPPMRITFNLAPASQPKSGSHYDLPMSVALLACMELLPPEDLQHCLVMGELGLDGAVLPVEGVLPAALEAQSEGYSLVCPMKNAREAAIVEGLKIIAPKTLLELTGHFGGTPLEYQANSKPEIDKTSHADMSEVKGLETQKRMLEIAAAGRHHVFLLGAPGVGKSLLASTLPSIMPPMTASEILETSLIHSVSGHLDGRASVYERPYFDPHHSASSAAIVGGGRLAKPGEISLAHNGVLFMDEFPEFKTDVLDSLRQPLESSEILIARAQNHARYPAKFLLVAAANPCKCGYFYDAEKWCGNAPICAQKYMGRISGPLMDRMTLRSVVPQLHPRELVELGQGESSETIRARVGAARNRAYERNGDGISNEDLGTKALDAQLIQVSAEAQGFMQRAVERLSLSPRGYYRLAKTALTISDLEGAEIIEPHHITEAVVYRLLDTNAPPSHLDKTFKKLDDAVRYDREAKDIAQA